MRISLATFILGLIFMPTMALAHATPVETTPASGAELSAAPESVTIRFSERLEERSSMIRVNDENGAVVTTGIASVQNEYTLSVPLRAEENGAYIVTWSVVSKDDGHFTRGSYAFSVGSSTISLAPESQVVQIASSPEVSMMFVEFVGNSLLWGALVMFALLIRPLFAGSREVEHVVSKSVYFLTVIAGSLCVVAGASLQIYIKSQELAGLHQVGLIDAFGMYLHTAAGSATLMRLVAIAVVGIAFAAFRTYLRSDRLNLMDGVLFAGLIIFAYFRATVSHATANPFHPEFSIFVNFLHVIEKDVWLGVLVVFILLLSRLPGSSHKEIASRLFSFLSFNFAALSVTASYIVWLHLKDFSNVSGSAWGEVFLKLLTASAVLIVLRTYHVVAARWKPQLFERLLSASIPAEAVAAACVVFFSSAIIVTSPPLHDATHTFVARDGDTTVRLERSLSEDGKALVTTSRPVEPLVLIGGSENPLEASLTQRFPGGYVFPLSLIATGTEVTVVVSQEGTYDARATFHVTPEDFRVPEGHGRTFDIFTIIVLIVALGAASYALTLHYLGRDIDPPIPYRISRGHGVFGGVSTALIILAMSNIAVGAFGNSFKAECERDGNMWHVMQPMQNGAPVSSTAREGCMLTSGRYHFIDKREYAYLRDLPPANVSLDAGSPASGKATSIRLSLEETDGSPAKLSIEHEKLLHVIIVSADMEYFAHVHPDDGRVYTSEELRTSSFTFSHNFPKAGTYLVAVDYMHGLKHESRQFHVSVTGSPGQSAEPRIYERPFRSKGYEVGYLYVTPFIGDIATLKFIVKKDGKLVTDLVPYLGAAMHIAIVKNDLSEFVHTHGEVHTVNSSDAPANATHDHAPPPARFGPNIEAHVAFPSSGTYTVFAEFKHGEQVIPAAFTVNVE